MKARDAIAALQRLDPDLELRLEAFRQEEIPAAEFEALTVAEQQRTARRHSDGAPVRIVRVMLEAPQGG